ncbi:MAG: hypothetical protein LBC37_03395 [Zoogloeaceae bacterium]|jgi:hypothetical protein|nr:hypothetical protein [Zoogloeaceae bacterium]
MGKNIRCSRVRKTIAIAELPETTHVLMRLHDVTPRWGYLILRPCSPRLTPGVIEIASLRDASCARQRFVWTVFLRF